MKVRCDLCGGENNVHPGQRMLRCEFCGSALSIRESSAVEHLILPHDRNDKTAEDTLRSFLASRGIAEPKNIKTRFSFVPYFILEDQKGGSSGYPSQEAPPSACPLPDPPAGNYRYFDARLADGEKIIEPASVDPDSSMIIHIPLYDISFNSGKKRYRAAVIGESWQVQTDRMPAKKPEKLELANLTLAAALFVAYLFLGKLSEGLIARMVLLLGASSTGFLIYKLREKVVSNGG